jgi:hypothetical protein
VELIQLAPLETVGDITSLIGRIANSFTKARGLQYFQRAFSSRPDDLQARVRLFEGRWYLFTSSA